MRRGCSRYAACLLVLFCTLGAGDASVVASAPSLQANPSMSPYWVPTIGTTWQWQLTGTIEPDNVDGYANSSGFPLSAKDQLAYNRWLAEAAHARGLSIALKNDLDQVAALAPYFDWALNEECFQYKECGSLAPFTTAGKA